MKESVLWERPVDRLFLQSQKKVLKDLRELRHEINALKNAVSEIKIRIQRHLEE